MPDRFDQPLTVLILSVAIVLPVTLGLGGCGGSNDETVPSVTRRPLRQMESLLRRGLSDQAWQVAPEVLQAHADDADVIAVVARLAYELEKPDRSASLLVDACRAESYGNEKRIEQTVIALVGVGRFYDAMDMLESCVAAQPDQAASRRLLFDLTMGAEQRIRGLPHGKLLVRERKFDLDLLMTLSNTERRTLDAAPLIQMTELRPQDKRPLVAQAKTVFDEGDYELAISLLREITDAHPDFMPAQTLLGRALAASGQVDALENWAAQQSVSIQAEPGFWIAMGDWARASDQAAAAARGYWEATRRDPDAMESWSKLAQSLAAVDQVDRELIDQVGKRVTLLSQFNQAKNRFERTGSISREIAHQMVGQLRQLGRPWEAEAWASIAMALPENQAVPLEQTRRQIIAELTARTPWQTLDGHPELRADLSFLDMPSIVPAAVAIAAGDQTVPVDPWVADSMKVGFDASSNRQAESETASEFVLEDEAAARGLVFFGRTSDRLDQPGIMLHETLGCGGGTLDFDLDGWPDVYLVAAGGVPPRKDSAANGLFRNLDGSFADVTGPASSGETGFGQGITVGDLNSDGFPDLLIANYGPNVALINNGDGTFSDATVRLGINQWPDAQTAWSTSAAVADFDGDGLGDLMVLNYCGGLEPSTETCPMEDPDQFRSCTPVKFPAMGDVVLQGQPDGTFVDRTETWKMRPDVPGRGLGIVVGSFDSSPGVEVLITNDMTNNHFWSGQKDGDQFALSESAMIRGLGTDDRSLPQGSMGIATGDFDRDGDTDFYVTNFDKEYNTLHQQRGAGAWQDQTSRLGLVEPTLPLVGFGTESVDLNHDGQTELVVSNGHVDIFSRGEERAIYAQPLQVFRRDDDGRYQSIASEVGGRYVAASHVGRALWTIDADRDGRLDLLVTHQTEPVALLVNRSGQTHRAGHAIRAGQTHRAGQAGQVGQAGQADRTGRWLRLQFVGQRVARDAVGTSVVVKTPSQSSSPIQSWTGGLNSGDGYLCSNQRCVHLGVGDAEGVEVEVRWPDGRVQSLGVLETNASWLVYDAQSPFRLDRP